MKRPAQSYFFVFTKVIVIAAVLRFMYVVAIGRTESGINLRRLDDENVRISWGTESGVGVSPTGTLRFMGFILKSTLEEDEPPESAWVLPPLSSEDGIWMFLVKPEEMGETVPADYVNPKLDGAIDRMFHMIALGREGNQNTDTLTRLAAESYIYLGYVVLNEDDAAALGTALSDRSKVDLEGDIELPEKRLYRLRPGVERSFVDDPDDEKALADVRKRIPVMFESINLEAGHPGDVMHVLYLDGHVEAIPYGERFPALPSFMKAFPPPSVAEPPADNSSAH